MTHRVPRAAIARTLRESRRVVIACHEAPDGDCLGAGLALAAALSRLGVAVSVASADGVPASLRFLPGAERVVSALPEDEPIPVAVTLECASLERTGALAPALRRAGMVVAIDHHPEPLVGADQVDWDPDAAAVGEQVAELIAHLGVEIDTPMAVALLTALVTDTGVFRYGNTTPRTLRLAADLVERGASIPMIVRAAYEDLPAAGVRLTGRALAAVTLHEDGAVATAIITPETRLLAGAPELEAPGLASMVRMIAGVRIAMTFDARNGVVHVSIRTRDGARADRVARALGGGGHAAAAGAQVAGHLEEVVRSGLEAARRELQASGGDPSHAG